ncbi:MAG: DUF222 domain-containing protein [Ilumatobacteraceae bacterium]
MSSWVLPDVVSLEAMTAAEREACWRAADRERARDEARMALFVHQLGDAGLHLVDGHRSMRAFGRAACNWSSAEAARFERLGRLLARFPQVGVAVDAGVLGVAQLHALARVAANPRVQAHLEESMDLLVEQAGTLDYDQLVIVLARWESLADEDGSGDRHERAHRNRNTTLHLGDHSFQLEANGGTAVGVQLKEILDAFTQAEFHADWEHGVAEHGERMCPGLMARSDAQRRADALLAIFQAAAGGETATGSNVTVNVVIGYDRFQHEVVKLLGGRPDEMDPSDLAQRCETVDGHQLDPRDVLIAAAMGHVRRVVVDSAGVIVDAGRRQRLFTGPLRDAVMLTATGCVWPGCHRPSSQCQADHVLPHANAGPTQVATGAPTCGHHNRWRTHGYTTRRDQHGHWHHHRPDGTEIGWRAHQHSGELAALGWRVRAVTLQQLLAA